MRVDEVSCPCKDLRDEEDILCYSGDSEGDTESAVPLLAPANGSPGAMAGNVCKDVRLGSLAHHDHL